jgi:hypothetical protein
MDRERCILSMVAPKPKERWRGRYVRDMHFEREGNLEFIPSTQHSTDRSQSQHQTTIHSPTHPSNNSNPNSPTMSALPLVSVVGATGTQGRSVLTALLATGQYRVRGLTRSPSSPASQALIKDGAEMVQADVSDLASLEKAFVGSYAIYAVTDFFAPFMANGLDQSKAQAIETQQGINLARAAAGTKGLEHYIWSTGPATLRMKGIKVPHLDSKAAVDDYIRKEMPELAKKTTFVWMGWYAHNFKIPTFTPVAVPGAEPGAYIQALDVPGSMEVPVMNSNVAPGVAVKAILANPERTKNGAYVLVARAWLSMDELLQLWAKVQRPKRAQGEGTFRAVYVQTSSEAMARLWGPWAAELSPMLKFFEVVKGKEGYKPGGEGVRVLEVKDLGVKKSELGGIEEALVGMREEGGA